MKYVDLTNWDFIVTFSRFAPYIAKSVMESVQRSIQNSNIVSILFNEATDVSILETEIVYCRFVENGYPRDVIVGIEEVEHAHADGIYDAVCKAMDTFVGPNWLDCLVAAGCDGAAVNIGVRNSVATRLQADHPYVLPIHCVAHRLELAVLGAIKNNAQMETVQDLLKKLYKHYHYSPKALRELRDIADSMDENIIKPTRLQGTRWVPHVQNALKALTRCYSVLVAHFEHVSQARPGETTPAVKGRATFVINKLKDFRTLRFVFFLQDLLGVIARLSLNLQKAQLTCVDYLDYLEAANLELTELRLLPGQSYTGFTDEIRQGQGVYKGVTLSHYDADVEYNYANVCDLVIQKIGSKLKDPNNTTTAIVKAARVFDTREWPNNRDDLATFGNAQIQLLADHFSDILVRNGCELAALAREWTLTKAHFGHRIINQPRPGRPVINTLFLLNDDRFENILKVVNVVLCLPMSSSICERGFSTLKRIKTDWRSRLTTDMMNHLLSIAIEGPSLDDYVAERAVQLWWRGGQRQRRPMFEAPQQAHGHDDEEEDQLLQFMLNDQNG